MLNEFLKEIEILLKKNQLVKLPIFRKVKLDKEKKSNISISFQDTLCSSNIISSELLISILVFELLDAFIEENYPETYGKSFSQKYRLLTTENNKQIMLKEMYRIMKILRNAAVHSKQNVNFSKNKVEVSYQFSNTNFCFKTEKLDLIYTLIVLLIKYFECKNKYIESLLCGYYKDIVSDISISDEYGESLILLNDSILCLQKRLRYIVLNPDFVVEKEYIKIKPYNYYKKEKDHSACDYCILLDGIYYLIPEEVLVFKDGYLIILNTEINIWIKDSCVQEFIEEYQYG